MENAPVVVDQPDIPNGVADPLPVERRRSVAEVLTQAQVRLEAMRDGLVRRYGEDSDVVREARHAEQVLDQLISSPGAQFTEEHPAQALEIAPLL